MRLPRGSLSTLALLGAIAIAGAVIGWGAGSGLAALGGGGPQDPLVVSPVETVATAETASDATVTVPTATDAAAATTTPATVSRARGGVRIHMFSAILHPAGTPVGKRRKRARISVHLRVTNDRSTALRALSASLVVETEVVPGAAEKGSALSFDRPLAPGDRADGRMRFETIGPVTERVSDDGRAAFRFAGVTISVPVLIGRPLARRA